MPTEWFLAAALLIAMSDGSDAHGTACDAEVPLLLCIDGLRQPAGATAAPCDADGATNGICVFEMPARPRKQHRRIRVRTGHTRQVSSRRVRGHKLCLSCVSGVEAGDTIICEDGVLATQLNGEVCDYDRACDGGCTFAFQCPACSYNVLYPCGAPCLTCPASVTKVPVGESQFIYMAPWTRADVPAFLVMTCTASAATDCRTTPTSTTLPPLCGSAQT